jgi:hypothetical protein
MIMDWSGDYEFVDGVYTRKVEIKTPGLTIGGPSVFILLYCSRLSSCQYISSMQRFQFYSESAIFFYTCCCSMAAI